MKASIMASPLYATAVGLVMDGLKRQERKRNEQREEEIEILESEQMEEEAVENGTIQKPKTERKSFLDKLTERVKDFLDNAE